MQCFGLEILLGNLLKNVVGRGGGVDGDEALYHRGFPGAVVSLDPSEDLIEIPWKYDFTVPLSGRGGHFTLTDETRCFQFKPLDGFQDQREGDCQGSDPRW